MGWYRTGTVTVTNGSAAVTGVGGIWLSQVSAGDLFTIDGTKFYEIMSVNSDTSITLQTTYTGTTQSGSAVHSLTYLGGFDTPYLGDKISDSYQGFSIDTRMWAMSKGSNATADYGLITGQPRGTLRMTFGNDAGGTMALNGSMKSGSLSWRLLDGPMFVETRFTTSSVANVVYFMGFTDTTDFECPFTLDGSANPVALATDAVGILYDTNGSSTAFYGVGVKAGVVTSVNLGNPPTSGGQVRWRVSLDMAGNATFFRNGVEVGSLANAVTTSIALAPVEGGFSRNNTSKYLQVDFTTIKQGSP